MCFIFFFDDTSTTDIYTYLHTLSLHDALPIASEIGEPLFGAIQQAAPPVAAGVGIRGEFIFSRLHHNKGKRRDVIDQCIPNLGNRSEEHTSELQSLMRISYAVFCLKKQKNQLQTQVIYITTIYINKHTS